MYQRSNWEEGIYHDDQPQCCGAGSERRLFFVKPEPTENGPISQH